MIFFQISFSLLAHFNSLLSGPATYESPVASRVARHLLRALLVFLITLIGARAARHDIDAAHMAFARSAQRLKKWRRSVSGLWSSEKSEKK